MHLECTFCIKASARCINVIAQITTPSDIGGTNRKSRPKITPLPIRLHRAAQATRLQFHLMHENKRLFPRVLCCQGVSLCKKLLWMIFWEYRTSVLVSPSLRILLFQSESVPGSAPLCQLLLCSSQHYFNFIPLFVSCTSWKMRIKTLSQCTPAVRNQKTPIRCLETTQLLMRRSRSHASNAEHLARRSFEESAKWSSTPLPRNNATGAVINSSVCLRQKPRERFSSSSTQTHFTHG